MSYQDDFILENIDDGHTPAGSTVLTKLAINRNKANSHFFSVYDSLVDDIWSRRAYEYALEKRRPWGVYILGKSSIAH
jgi:hypothetical protein